jgi:Fe-S-cluster-containing dehydrogenase component/formate-dependent nitrite reductase membrane component NrfD
MANYGFLIDQSRCIGCHACSVACKSENQVPLGVYRTWVKYVEVGEYPDVRRHFQVTRCNHCANPPCVRICPVGAMYQRHDGIVEFDSSICIGCKSCIQACPYDSIYLDPNTHTAAKCHFCAHRIEMGLEPACVVVCPEHAIIAGDLDDPNSEISRKLARSQVTVRKPEQGTGPKLFYINGNDWALHPTASSTSASYMWADRITEQNVAPYGQAKADGGRASAGERRAASGVPIRTPQTQGMPLNGPIQIGGRVAEQMVQTAYIAQHKIYWHWELPAYLVTKNIAGGLFMYLSLGVALGSFPFDSLVFILAGFVSLLFTLITALLLIKDLSQPKRFFTILLRPQWKSWVARGAFVLVGFSAVAGIWWLLEMLAWQGVLQPLAPALRPFFAWVTFPLALLAVIYTAFLLGQAEGRDMWQNPLLPFQLFAQAVMVAGGVFLLLSLFIPFPESLHSFLARLFPAAIFVDLLLMLAGKFTSFASEVALLGYREMTKGRFRNAYWWGGVVLGHLVPLVLLLLAPFLMPLAVVCTVVGLFFYEYAFVMAPQYIPNS